MIQVGLHRRSWTRCIGQQRDVPPLAFPPKQPFPGSGKQLSAVMYDTPDIAQDCAVPWIEIVERIHRRAMARPLAGGKPP